IAELQERLNRLAPGDALTRKETPSTGPSVTPSAVASREQFSPPKSEATTPTTAESDGSWPLTASWKDGLQFKSRDEEFRVHVGGLMQFDAGWNAASEAVQFGPGGIGELQDGAVFRRARLRIDGTLYKHFEWVTEFD